MSQATANQLIAGIGGSHVAAFFLVLARVSTAVLHGADVLLAR